MRELAPRGLPAGRRSGASRRARARRRRLERDLLTALTAIAFYSTLSALGMLIAWSLSS
jgi:hypothetical protein